MDHNNCTTFICDYLHTQFDPAHLLSELGFTIAFELLQLLLIVWLWRKVVKPKLYKSFHKQFDEEHEVNHTNQPPTVHTVEREWLDHDSLTNRVKRPPGVDPPPFKG